MLPNRLFAPCVGLERRGIAVETIDEVFAPCVGLESMSEMRDYLLKLFAPCVGLESERGSSSFNR